MDRQPRIIDETFLMEFAKSYNTLKDDGMIPVGIKKKLMVEFECKESSYYRYLQLARDKGYVSDSYEENTTAMRKREAKLREAHKVIEPDMAATLREILYGNETKVEEKAPEKESDIFISLHSGYEDSKDAEKYFVVKEESSIAQPTPEPPSRVKPSIGTILMDYVKKIFTKR